MRPCAVEPPASDGSSDTHVSHALSLVLGAKAVNQDLRMVVVVVMKKDGLVLSDSLQEGRPAHASEKVVN